MKTLIVFASKYGATAECAKRIAALLPGETVLHRLGEGECPAPEEFDGVICGTSIYMGQPRKEMKRFVKTHAAALQKQSAYQSEANAVCVNKRPQGRNGYGEW